MLAETFEQEQIGHSNCNNFCSSQTLVRWRDIIRILKRKYFINDRFRNFADSIPAVKHYRLPDFFIFNLPVTKKPKCQRATVDYEQ